jgi:hypothetical protein
MDKLARKLVSLGDRFIDKNGSRKFHLEAAQLLAAADFQKSYSFGQLVSLSFKKNIETIQNYRAFEFSDLPLTLARGRHCFMDLYVWRRRPTVIHNHHFTGAFQCLEGSNVDLSFSFKTKKKFGKFHSTGELKLEETRKVLAGDVVPIDLQDRFIHQNHHHHDLTVNLCFRTPDVRGKRIANFLYSGLRYEKDPSTLARTERFFRLLKIGPLHGKELNLTSDDALSFLLQSYGSHTENSHFLDFRKYCSDRIRKECKLNLDDLLDDHEGQLDLIQSNYD